MVEHVGPRAQHVLQGGAHAFEVGRQHLHGTAGHVRADLANSGGEDQRAAVGLIVTVDRGHDDVLEAHGLHSAGDALRLAPIQRAGAARLDRAESAGAGAGVAQDHEGGRAMAPALPNVRAACLLAHRVQR